MMMMIMMMTGWLLLHFNSSQTNNNRSYQLPSLVLHFSLHKNAQWQSPLIKSQINYLHIRRVMWKKSHLDFILFYFILFMYLSVNRMYQAACSWPAERITTLRHSIGKQLHYNKCGPFSAKTIVKFPSAVTWPSSVTFWPQSCSASYTSYGWPLIEVWTLYDVPFTELKLARDGQTDGRRRTRNAVF